MIKGQLLNIDLPLQGMTQLASILEIVKNEKLYNKRLKVLEQHKQDIVVLIQTVGEVEEIEAIKAEIVREKEIALGVVKELEDEKILAGAATTEAQRNAKSITSDALEQMTEQKVLLDMREKALQDKQTQLGQREREIQLSEVKTDKAHATVELELKRLAALQKLADGARLDFENRQVQLEKAISGI